MNQRWLSPCEVSRLHDVCEKTVRRHLTKKTLPGKLVGGRWRINPSDAAMVYAVPRSPPVQFCPLPKFVPIYLRGQPERTMFLTAAKIVAALHESLREKAKALFAAGSIKPQATDRETGDELFDPEFVERVVRIEMAEAQRYARGEIRTTTVDPDVLTAQPQFVSRSGRRS